MMGILRSEIFIIVHRVQLIETDQLNILNDLSLNIIAQYYNGWYDRNHRQLTQTNWIKKVDFDFNLINLLNKIEPKFSYHFPNIQKVKVNQVNEPNYLLAFLRQLNVRELIIEKSQLNQQFYNQLTGDSLNCLMIYEEQNLLIDLNFILRFNYFFKFYLNHPNLNGFNLIHAFKRLKFFNFYQFRYYNCEIEISKIDQNQFKLRVINVNSKKMLRLLNLDLDQLNECSKKLINELV